MIKREFIPFVLEDWDFKGPLFYYLANAIGPLRRVSDLWHLSRRIYLRKFLGILIVAKPLKSILNKKHSSSCSVLNSAYV